MLGQGAVETAVGSGGAQRLEAKELSMLEVIKMPKSLKTGVDKTPVKAWMTQAPVNPSHATRKSPPPP